MAQTYEQRRAWLRSDVGRAYRRALIQRSRRALRAAVLELYGGCCAVCGEDDPDLLEMDHIHNDGGLHRKQRKGWASYKDMRDRFDPSRYQVLCADCNRRKENRRRKEQAMEGVSG